jgi:hypothetical protein
MNGPGPSVVAWNPQLVAEAPPTVELYVTCGEGHVGNGTDAFVVELLRDAQVDFTAIRRWSAEPYRAFYFTSYPSADEEWEDRWPLAWRFTVSLSTLPVIRGTEGKYWSEAFDESASWSTPPPSGAHCLVLADFEDQVSAETARELIGRHGRIGRAMQRFWQLAIDLGPRDDAFYASGAGEAFAVMDRCRDLGGTVHYSDRQPSVR